VLAYVRAAHLLADLCGIVLIAIAVAGIILIAITVAGIVMIAIAVAGIIHPRLRLILSAVRHFLCYASWAYHRGGEYPGVV
jgi:hypothetical protein